MNNNRKKQNLPCAKTVAGEIPSLKLTDTTWKYLDRFYNQFQSKYEVSGDCITDESLDYMMRRFWSDGTCALYRIPNTDMLGVAQFAPVLYNIWDKPDTLQLVNRREASKMLIPTKTLMNKKDVVIAKIRPDGKPIYPLAKYYANKLSSIDKAIECNLLAVRTPWILLADASNIKRINEFMRRYIADDICLTLNPDDVNSIQVLQTTANYIIDKLEVEKTQTLHEALDELGFDNCAETGNRAIVAEVSINSAATQDINDMYNQCLKQMEDNVKEVLGLTIHFEPRSKQVQLLSNKMEQTPEGRAEHDAKEDTTDVK